MLIRGPDGFKHARRGSGNIENLAVTTERKHFEIYKFITHSITILQQVD